MENHKCEKWSMVEDGYQYCLECGKALPAPPLMCKQHILETIRERVFHRISDKVVTQVHYIQKCTLCGEISTHQVDYRRILAGH